jgi:lipooligosaccharide transport system ATP-binding protein
MAAVIEAAGLTKRYAQRTVVRALDLHVPPGRCVGLLGPNGAGKTTTLRMLLGHTPFEAGRLRVLGLPVPQAARQVRARTGVVPQTDNLDPDFTVAENLEVYGRYFAIPRARLLPRIRELLEFVELGERAESRIPTLSGGMKRRLTIARALVNDPELLILDEPTTGLDPQARHMIWARLRALRAQGKTLLLTTHYMEEAERLCDEIVIMDQGRILDQGTPQALIRRHVEPEVVEIRGEEHVVRAALGAEAAHCRIETVGDTVYCYARHTRALVARLEGAPALTFLHRPANLEDVFLKLTGRELRD